MRALYDKGVNLDSSLLSQTQWFLDYDGSLCPHLEVWEERSYDPQRIYTLVTELNKRSAGVFWNTGRRPDSLASVFPGFMEIPGYFIHGSVFWNAKTQATEILSPLLPEGLAEKFTKIISMHHEFRIEVKPTGLRINPYRLTDFPKFQRFLDSQDLYCPPGWQWHVGARGAELLPVGFDKSTALQRELNDTSIPIAVGDDRFDGKAFEFALQRRGFVIAVGENLSFLGNYPHQSWQMIYADQSLQVLDRIESLLESL